MPVAEADRHNDHHEQEAAHMDLARSGDTRKRLRIVPIRRPSVAPHLCHRGCAPVVRRAAFSGGTARGWCSSMTMVLATSPCEEAIMQTTTATTAGPTDIVTRRSIGCQHRPVKRRRPTHGAVDSQSPSISLNRCATPCTGLRDSRWLDGRTSGSRFAGRSGNHSSRTVPQTLEAAACRAAPADRSVHECPAVKNWRGP